jgi:hypothetical protein
MLALVMGEIEHAKRALRSDVAVTWRRTPGASMALTPSTIHGGDSSLAWRTGRDDNGLLGALEPIDLLFEFGDLLLSPGQGTRRIRDPIDLGRQTVNQNIRLKK